MIRLRQIFALNILVLFVLCPDASLRQEVRLIPFFQKEVSCAHDEMSELIQSSNLRSDFDMLRGVFTPHIIQNDRTDSVIFNPSTVIEFALPKRQHVRLKIFDLSGREVETLVNGVYQPGLHKIEWNASGRSSGVYFYRIITDEYTMTKKLIFIQ